MNKHSILSISAITALGLVLYSSSAVAQSAKDIVGTWTIESAEAFGPTARFRAAPAHHKESAGEFN
jgi:hypothetical protein